VTLMSATSHQSRVFGAYDCELLGISLLSGLKTILHINHADCWLSAPSKASVGLNVNAFYCGGLRR
jgi:hypothetical protein